MPNWQQAFYQLLEERVFPLPSGDRTFNFYRDGIPGIDLPNGPDIRRSNLRRYILSVSRPRFVLIGEAPGPRGARFSGVPFASERQLVENLYGLAGQCSSLGTRPFKENSATVFRKVVAPFSDTIFAWNSFPILPHQLGNLRALRSPRDGELEQHRFLIQRLVEWTQPELVLAIGRRAQASLNASGIVNIYVRHPSHGGTRLFESGVRKLLEPLYLFTKVPPSQRHH